MVFGKFMRESQPLRWCYPTQDYNEHTNDHYHNNDDDDKKIIRDWFFFPFF